MTGYHLRLGYNANNFGSNDKEELIKIFVEEYKHICKYPLALKNEYNLMIAPECHLDYDSDYIQAYKEKTDSTIKL